uniref:Kappa-Sparatoxin-Hju1l_1 n=2 Tax=Heteropoda jugulans TaxID=1358901 RepID=A0A4Q8KDC2_9ARAC
MKFILVLMLTFVAFSAVALAENSIKHPAMDLVVARDDCGTLFSPCSTQADCCDGYACRLWCKYKI